MMKGIKILTIIDDDEIFVYLTKRTIRQTGLVEHIEVFNNGLDALDFLDHNKDNAPALPEIIFLDLNMPIMDGWQFLEEFSKIIPKIQKSITVYICSSSISPDDISRAESNNEVTDYIIKPITKDILMEVIEKL